MAEGFSLTPKIGNFDSEGNLRVMEPTLTSEKTPQSPVIFDTFSRSMKNLVFDSDGAAEFDVFGSISDADPTNPSIPKEPARWKFFGSHIVDEPKVTFLDPQILQELMPYRWIRVDRKRGATTRVQLMASNF